MEDTLVTETVVDRVGVIVLIEDDIEVVYVVGVLVITKLDKRVVMLELDGVPLEKLVLSEDTVDLKELEDALLDKLPLIELEEVTVVDVDTIELDEVEVVLLELTLEYVE